MADMGCVIRTENQAGTIKGMIQIHIRNIDKCTKSLVSRLTGVCVLYLYGSESTSIKSKEKAKD